MDPIVKILAIDTAATTGWAVFTDGQYEASGYWRFNPRKPLAERWLAFEERVRESVDDYHPDALVYEEVIGHRNISAQRSYHGYETILMLTAHAEDLPCHGIAVGKVKRTATGSGKATKEDMVEAACDISGRVIEDHNEADAICVGYTYFKEQP